MSAPRQLRTFYLCTCLQHTPQCCDQLNDQDRDDALPTPGTRCHADVIARVTTTAPDGRATPRRWGSRNPASPSSDPPARRQRCAVRFLVSSIHHHTAPAQTAQG